MLQSPEYCVLNNPRLDRGEIVKEEGGYLRPVRAAKRRAVMLVAEKRILDRWSRNCEDDEVDCFILTRVAGSQSTEGSCC